MHFHRASHTNGMSNNITVTGNITSDPEVRYTNSTGKAVCEFGLADNRRVGTNGEAREVASFYRVTAWDTLADNIGNSLQKGDRVIVSGRIEVQNWEDAEGVSRTTVKIVADEVGPSLRWAEAEVVKNTKPVKAAPKQRASSRSVRPVEDDEEYGDEDGYEEPKETPTPKKRHSSVRPVASRPAQQVEDEDEQYEDEDGYEEPPAASKVVKKRPVSSRAAQEDEEVLF